MEDSCSKQQVEPIQLTQCVIHQPSSRVLTILDSPQRDRELHCQIIMLEIAELQKGGNPAGHT